MMTEFPFFFFSLDRQKRLGNIAKKFEDTAPVDWANPLVTPLPHAPNMTIYCLYGYGKVTERGYIYQRNPESCGEVPFVVNTSFSSENPSVRRGIANSDGDGTVPLISLGFPCVKSWKSVTTKNFAEFLQN